MTKKTLNEWLAWGQQLNPVEIDLSLDRVLQIAQRLRYLKPPCVVTVAGTNGKGSCVALLEAIYLAAGYRVGTFNSPVLFHHNEYVCLQGIEASDELFCQAFENVEHARGDIPLTFFEFNTLAAFDIFHQAALDVWILEVGLGGRLDAVNVMDADVAIIATIALDHMQWLGETRDQIAREKAGIFRSNHPAVCGDVDPPAALLEYAKKMNVPLFCQKRDFRFEKKTLHWDFISPTAHYKDLPLSALALQNMSTVLMAIELLQAKLPVDQATIAAALQTVQLPGRIQIVSMHPRIVLDVSHNPAAADFLALHLKDFPVMGKTYAVFSMLNDKDILQTVIAMKKQVSEWHIAEIQISRGASLALLQENFQQAGIDAVNTHASIPEALHHVLRQAGHDDQVIVFGSFHTVSMAFKTLKARACNST